MGLSLYTFNTSKWTRGWPIQAGWLYSYVLLVGKYFAKLCMQRFVYFAHAPPRSVYIALANEYLGQCQYIATMHTQMI